MARSRTSTSFNFAIDYVEQGIGSRFGITTPYFANESIAVRVAFLETAHRFDVFGEYNSLNRHSVEISPIFSRFIVANELRAYLRTGIGLVIPDSQISDLISVSFALGLGLEYFPWETSRFGFMAELAGMDTAPGKAEKLPKHPFYGRGPMAVLGVNIYL